MEIITLHSAERQLVAEMLTFPSTTRELMSSYTKIHSLPKPATPSIANIQAKSPGEEKSHFWEIDIVVVVVESCVYIEKRYRGKQHKSETPKP